jgi:hypothetical protein
MSKITPNDRGGQRLDSMAPALNDYRDVKAALEQLGSVRSGPRMDQGDLRRGGQ